MQRAAYDVHGHARVAPRMCDPAQRAFPSREAFAPGSRCASVTTFSGMARSTIAFLGQCHTSGYEGVSPDQTFPQVCKRHLEARRPGTTIDVLIEQYHHPGELPRMTARVLRARPRVVVIEAVGWLAIKGREAVDLSRLPRRIGSAYQRLRHFRYVGALARAQLPITAGVVSRVRTGAVDLASGVLRPLIPRYPRPTLEEYEVCLDAALGCIGAVPGAVAVVQGPGSLNAALDSRGLAGDAVDRYHAVAGLARRSAEAHGAMYIDRWDSVGAAFYIPGTIRPDTCGHLVWGHLLAERLIEGGII